MIESLTIDASTTAAVIGARFLTPLARTTQALAVNAKQAHWNLRGANFIAIHQLLDVVAAHARNHADLAAERVVALGLPIDARLTTIATTTPPTAVAGSFMGWEVAIDQVAQDITKAIDEADRAVAGLDGTDLPSQDIAVTIKAALQNDRWLLLAHLGEPSTSRTP